MDTKTIVDGPLIPAEWIHQIQTSAQSDLSSHAQHALDGCLFGLTPNSAQTHVQPGEAYVDGNRLRLRAAHAIDLAGLTRPTGTMVAWVSVFAAYATDGSLTVTDLDQVQHTLCVDDGIIISVSRGADAASESAAVKPTIPAGNIVLCDMLLDATTAVGSLDGDPSRRPKCPDDELREGLSQQNDALRAVQMTLAAAIQKPDKGPTPTATSTVSLRVDATWAAGTVGAGVPLIHSYRFRWRQAGEDWSELRTTTLEDVRTMTFTVPDDNSDIEMEVQVGNSNGFGPWSDDGTLDASDIEGVPQVPNRGPRPTATSTQSLQVDAVWAAGSVPAGAPAVSRYRFRWRQAGDGWVTAQTFTLGNVRAYDFDVPDSFSDIQMQVQTGNSNGFGAWSVTRTLDAGDIEDSTILSPNRGPTPTATSTVSLRVDSTWVAGTVPAGAPVVNGYQFRWRQDGDGWVDSQTFTLGNIRAYMFTVPDSFSDIQMQVRTGNSNGFGDWSPTGTIDAADITDSTVLLPNRGPRPTATSTRSLEVDAAWAAGTVPSGAPAINGQQFRWRQEGDGWIAAQTFTLGGTIRSRTFTVPDSFSDIEMEVRTRNVNGYGQWSLTRTLDSGDIADSTILRPNRGPRPTATSTVSLQVDAAWSAGTVPSGAPAVTGYRFRWRQEGEAWDTAQTTTLGNVLAYEFTVPDSNEDIEMEVQTGNVNGYGQWSDTGTIDASSIEDSTILRPNGGPTPAATSTVSLQVDATWAAGTVPSGAPAVNRYLFRWRQAGNGWSTAQTFVLGNVLAYEFTVPDSNEDIEMAVRTGNVNGFGPWSPTGTILAADIFDSTVLIPNGGPTPAATSTVSLRVDATWAAGTVPGGAPAINGYQFRWRQDGEDWSTAQTFTLGNVRAYMFTVLDSNEEIQMQVQTGNVNGFGPWGTTGTIDAGDITDSTILRPNTGPRPTAISTQSLQVDAVWAAGTVPNGAPAVNGYQFRWRQLGEQWVLAQRVTLGNVRAYMFAAPDSNLDIQMEVRTGNVNGYGDWGTTGTIDAGDITDSTILRPNRGPRPTATSTENLSVVATWADGTVPSGAPAINIQQFRWRQEGEQWAETFTVASGIRAVVFTVPDASEDIEMEVRLGNTNGYGQWSVTGTFDANDIFNASILTPNKGPTPTATSTEALQIDATWAVGTVPTSAPAITGAQLRWRKAGENWADNRTITLGNVQAHSFDVPDADSDIQMQVAYRNSNGFGAWSDTGTIDAADIANPPPLMTRTYNTAGANSYTWEYPQSTRARVTMQGGEGGAGGGGGGGGAGGSGGVGDDGGDGGAGGGSTGGHGHNGGGGGGGGPDGGGGGGGNGRRAFDPAGDGGIGSGSGDDGVVGHNAEDAGEGDTSALGGGGGGISGGGGGGGGALEGDAAGSGGGGGGAGGSGGEGDTSSGGGGGGGGGGGALGGDGGDGGDGSGSGGTDGGGGGGGSQGADGALTRVVITSRSVNISATGGAGGGGGGGGGGAELTAGGDGSSGTSSGGGGAGGAGGAGGVGNVTGGTGGVGAAGVSSQQTISDISGLVVGDVFTITVGDGGAGGGGGGGGGGYSTATTGSTGSNGSAGAAGSVTITPLT